MASLDQESHALFARQQASSIGNAAGGGGGGKYDMNNNLSGFGTDGISETSIGGSLNGSILKEGSSVLQGDMINNMGSGIVFGGVLGASDISHGKTHQMVPSPVPQGLDSSRSYDGTGLGY
jgi:hypothetical protein